MDLIYHIIKFKLLSFLKLNLNFSFDNLLKNVGSFFVYTIFAIGAFIFSHEAVKYLLEQFNIGLFLLHEFFSITLFIFFIAVNIGNIIVSYSTLYKSQEVNYLFTRPIPPSTIFVIKFFDNFLYSSSTLILILLSVLGGYAYYLDYSVLDVVILFLFNFLPFMLTAASLGIIILLLLVKLSTLLGIRTIIFTIVSIYLFSIYMFFDIISPVDLVDKVMQFYPNVDLYFGNYLPESLKFFPNHWLSNSLYWVSRDNYTAALSSFYLQIVTSLVLFGFAVFLGMKWYHKTWFYELRLRKANTKNDLDRVLSFRNKSKFVSTVESVVKREFHNFFREPTQIFHSVVLLIMMLLFLSSVPSVFKLEDITIFLQTVIYLSIIIFNTFLVATLALRFVFPLISLEGRIFWKIKSAPISTLNILRMKLLPYFFIISFVALILNIVVNLRLDFMLLLITSVITLFVAAALILLNFSIGGLYANFNEKNPIRIASSQGASLSFLISLFLMVGLIVVLFSPVQQSFNYYFEYGNYYYKSLYYATGIIILVSFVIFFISHKIMLRVVEKDF